MHFAGEQLMAPREAPASLRHLARLPRAFKFTDKAVMGAAHGREITNDAVNLARLVFGAELGGQPVIGGIINASSPLEKINEAVEAMERGEALRNVILF